MAPQGKDPGRGRQSFVGKEDHPEVEISLDTPLSELHVRELGTILGFMVGRSPFEAGKTSLKDFFDKDFPEVAKDWVKEIKIEKAEKPEKPEKFEKNEKHGKNEKFEKLEKLEKPELKDLKPEKVERETVFDPGLPPGSGSPDRTGHPGCGGIGQAGSSACQSGRGVEEGVGLRHLERGEGEHAGMVLFASLMMTFCFSHPPSLSLSPVNP